MPEITHLDLSELLAPSLTTELGRSLTRARVQQYDLDKVTALVFVVDRGALKPGTSGAIWLDDLALY